MVPPFDMKRVAIGVTNAFTKHGAHFNQGAALNVALEYAKPTDWVLSINCDVLPPTDWREQLGTLEPGILYGCHRSDRQTTEPYGYFQLWHVLDPNAAPFPECYGHAGRYDAVFLERWPPEKRRMLQFTVEHLGQPATHWHGPGNDHLTAELLRNGVGKYRQRDERLASSWQVSCHLL
jgi:hypothetical protein